MFMSRYPSSDLVHERVLQCQGNPRGLSLVPIGRPPVPPPEIVHRHSTLILSPIPGKAFVMEWTGDQTDRHRVDV